MSGLKIVECLPHVTLNNEINLLINLLINYLGGEYNCLQTIITVVNVLSFAHLDHLGQHLVKLMRSYPQIYKGFSVYLSIG